MKDLSIKELRKLAKYFEKFCKSKNFDIKNKTYKSYWESLSEIRCELLKRKQK